MSDITSNLQIWWKLDEGGGSNPVDSSGNSHTGAFYNTSPAWTLPGRMPYYSGGFDKTCLTFDNSGTDGLYADSYQIPATGSLAFWVKPARAYNSGTDEFLAFYGTLATGSFEFRHYSSNDIYVGFNRSGNDDRIVLAASDANYTQNVWQHYLVTWTATGATLLYRNGVLIATGPDSATNTSTAAGVHTKIGINETWTNAFNGDIDDVRIYTRALSADDALALYAYNGVSASGLPQFVADGAIATDTTGAASTTPILPTHQADDILLVVAVNASGNSMSTATSGWTKIAEVDGTSNIAWFWKRATGSGTAGPTITASDTDQFAIGYVIRGCVTTGTPFEDATTSGDGTTATSTPVTAEVTTTANGRMIYAFCAWDTNAAININYPPIYWAHIGLSFSSTGTGAGFCAVSTPKLLTGTEPSIAVCSLVSSPRNGCLTLAFIPANTLTITTVNITTPGSSQVVIPSNVTGDTYIETWGGGGGGIGPYGGLQGAGGAGGGCRKTIAALPASTTLDCVCGAGGAGSSGVATGNPGLTSSVVSGALLETSAAYGTGGSYSTLSYSYGGGVAGTAVIASANYGGGTGGNDGGASPVGPSSGGGSSASPYSDGNNAGVPTGGASVGTDSGAGGNGGDLEEVGTAGSYPGGGGGGTSIDADPATGANGAAGKIRIVYEINPTGPTGAAQQNHRNLVYGGAV